LKFTSTENSYGVLFHNGSTLKVVASNDNSRGEITIASMCGNIH